MLKHATINRTSKAQQTLQLQRQWQSQRSAADHQEVGGGGLASERLPLFGSAAAASSRGLDEVDSGGGSGYYRPPSPQPPPLLPSHPAFSSCNPSPSPTLLSPTPTSSLLSTPTKYRPTSPTTTTTNKHLTSSPTKYTSSSDSIIKVFAQSLSQDVEYVTLRVNAQTKSQQIIKSLLRKFRLKHRDPNLFYLTLERWIRKDGLKTKSVMLLSDEASPLQLQQCCSNPPHNDIKFTLQTKAGVLVKIFCSDVAPDACYKCLSLSTQTTVDETIELMLHCLNLVTANGLSATTDHSSQTPHLRQSGSPSSTSSSASSSCSTSSGIESDCNPNQNHSLEATTNNLHLNSDSRASSITSISSTSNISSISSSITEQYCLVVECKDTSFRRILNGDEYLVDVYQNLLLDSKIQQTPSPPPPTTNGNDANANRQSDQWFSIKLKRRDEQQQQQQQQNKQPQAIKFTIPRQNVPLPPIPPCLNSYYNVDNLQSIVSTTQIEVNQRSVCNNLALSNNNGNSGVDIIRGTQIALEGEEQQKSLDVAAAASTATTTSTLTNQQQPPPPQFILLPPIRPRRRNLSNVSSTFGRPLPACSNRRRYDPAQLADDLSKLDVTKETDMAFRMPLNDKMSFIIDISSCEAKTANNNSNSNNDNHNHER